ncbi:MAG: phosphoribosylformylglycinamidine synthase subunit PurL [Chloroflexi bacterium]|nr:phosphoribosylformylglycinamidine synthase subunit PurL [Chloroflexota bacterium]
MTIHCLIVTARSEREPRAASLLTDAHALGLTRVRGLTVSDLYFIDGDLSGDDRARLASELLSDPVTQNAEWRTPGAVRPAVGGHVIEVALRPGVTDPVAEQIMRCALMIGVQSVRHASTGIRFVVFGDLSNGDLRALARRLLANEVIQRHALGEIEPIFPQEATASGHVETIALRELDDGELAELSRQRRAALNLAEMQAMQAYYRAEGRDPSDVEFETIAQTWSEHCVHKTFKAQIRYGDRDVDGILRTYIRAATEQIAAPWVRSAFVDNAGSIDFDDEYEVSFKVETHNHPSAIEPFGGANTGVGGVIRDVLGVSAKPIAATDVLCFGPQDVAPDSLPEGVLHPRRIRSGVVAGVQDYGNKIGIPTVSGAIVYDPGYTANPLVFCGCVGLAPKGAHVREPRTGDRIIVLGGRTGRDGLRGATFSSMTMDAQTGEVAGASVQIGDPIVEKGLIEVITRARDARLYDAITDCGAGGFSSAVGEMASQSGAQVELERAPLKYPGLAPWEIWLSEAQERMVLAVPPANVPALQTLCDTFDIELTDIGAFDASGHLVVRHDGRAVLDLDNSFLHDGLPRRSLVASAPQPAALAAPADGDATARLLRILGDPNTASKADVIRRYDHEVQGGTVIKPLAGAACDGPSDGVVLKPIGTRGTRGIVLACGINPAYGAVDPYRMAVSVVDEAIRNAVAAGADPSRIALLDNFCWGDPNRPETLGALVEAARGCHDAALHYGAPFISGKDSLNNEYLGADGLRHAIPPTLLISAIGLIEDVQHAVSMDAKEAGNILYRLGAAADNAAVPGLPAHAPAMYATVHRAMQAGLIRACHDLSEGGLAVAAAEMAIAGRLGMRFTSAPGDLFAETNGALLVEVRTADAAAFESHFDSALARRIGVVTSSVRFVVEGPGTPLIDAAVDNLVAAWTHDGQVN